MSIAHLTARQKMIGVMYLVLTAMLALQVSSSVLDKFMLLSLSMDKRRQLQLNQNERSIQSLKTAVSDMGGRPVDTKVLEKVVSIHKETLDLMSYIDGLKDQLITLSGGIDPSTHLPKSLKNTTTVSRLMCNQGEGDILKSKLTHYVAYLSDQTHHTYLPIAFDGKAHPFFSQNPNQSSKDFVALNFDHTPIGAAFATLSQFASEVVSTEADAINRLCHHLGTGDLKFDQFKLLAHTASYIVPAGSQYKADLVLSASSSAVSPEMCIDDQPIFVQDGVGKVSFTALPGKYDDQGFSRKTFKASIKLKLPGGKESTLTQSIPYVVAKPVIQVRSASIQSLYYNCGNQLNIQVPSLGIAYNPIFKAEGAVVIQSAKKGVITIIPKSKDKEVKLKVYQEGHLIGTESFMVQEIPTPQISLTSNNKPIDLQVGLPVSALRRLEAEVISNNHFKSFLRKDARYQVVEWTVTLARGSRPIQTLHLNQPVADLYRLTALSKPGDRLVVQIKKLERKNFKDEIETIVDRSCFNIILH
ncbi:gliding motility protein GldM [Candidatus Cardinium hertigii]|uniref:type IX secretion system motor protein PorM/GldM n=1 Tax=Candidatus Cardinium hertigii TaxID=247481 RepID=UPI003D7E1D61